MKATRARKIKQLTLDGDACVFRFLGSDQSLQEFRFPAADIDATLAMLIQIAGEQARNAKLFHTLQATGLRIPPKATTATFVLSVEVGPMVFSFSLSRDHATELLTTLKQRYPVN